MLISRKRLFLTFFDFFKKKTAFPNNHILYHFFLVKKVKKTAFFRKKSQKIVFISDDFEKKVFFCLFLANKTFKIKPQNPRIQWLISLKKQLINQCFLGSQKSKNRKRICVFFIKKK